MIYVIQNIHLFKTECLEFSIEDRYDDKYKQDIQKIIHEVLKLSLNPQRTVKRVTFNDIKSNLIERVLNKLNFKNYNIKELPRIFSDNNEIMFNIENIEKILNNKVQKNQILFYPQYSLRQSNTNKDYHK